MKRPTHISQPTLAPSAGERPGKRGVRLRRMAIAEAPGPATKPPDADAIGSPRGDRAPGDHPCLSVAAALALLELNAAFDAAAHAAGLETLEASARLKAVADRRC